MAPVTPVSRKPITYAFSKAFNTKDGKTLFMNVSMEEKNLASRVDKSVKRAYEMTALVHDGSNFIDGYGRKAIVGGDHFERKSSKRPEVLTKDGRNKAFREDLIYELERFFRFSDRYKAFIEKTSLDNVKSGMVDFLTKIYGV